jgi:hypothetical protein
MDMDKTYEMYYECANCRQLKVFQIKYGDPAKLS